LIATEWARTTGTRTHVAETGQLGQPHDLPALVHHLRLLAGVAVGPERVDLRDHVEGDLAGKDLARQLGALRVGDDLRLELARASVPAPVTDW
jgi:hypothetical protein